jgi:CRISPR/Cas system CMR-associated protein Cmr1 (group 7 of RAMP superfamily)
MTRHRVTFITPLFSKGSYEDRPEVRAPSIRGQLHWWFRALGGSSHEENAIFGSVHARPVLASKVVVRVADVNGQAAELNTLPHKRGGEASPKWAYKPGTSFDLLLTERLGGLTNPQRQAFRRTLEAWLLAGTLGLRATRAAGSFIWHPLSNDAIAMPGKPAEYATRLADIFRSAPLRVSLLEPAFSSAEAARTAVSDTLGGRHDGRAEDDLARINHPLGRVFGGRKTSPLRFRIVQFGQAFHIVAVWDDRTAVTGNQPGHYDATVRLLSDRNKEIGPALAKPLLPTNP